jgi:hypothetical protein
MVQLLVDLNADLSLKGWIETTSGHNLVSPIELISILEQGFGPETFIREMRRIISPIPVPVPIPIPVQNIANSSALGNHSLRHLIVT